MKSKESLIEYLSEILERLIQLEKKIATYKSTGSMEFRWMDIETTCKLLKISSRTLQRYRDAGKIGFSQTGSKIYFSQDEVIAYLERNYKEPFNK